MGAWLAVVEETGMWVDWGVGFVVLFYCFEVWGGRGLGLDVVVGSLRIILRLRWVGDWWVGCLSLWKWRWILALGIGLLVVSRQVLDSACFIVEGS